MIIIITIFAFSVIGMMRGLYFSLATGIAVELSGKEKAAEAYALAFVAWGVGSALAAVVPGKQDSYQTNFFLQTIYSVTSFQIIPRTMENIIKLTPRLHIK